jgi:hypothetical protein
MRWRHPARISASQLHDRNGRHGSDSAIAFISTSFITRSLNCVLADVNRYVESFLVLNPANPLLDYIDS